VALPGWLEAGLFFALLVFLGVSLGVFAANWSAKRIVLFGLLVLAFLVLSDLLLFVFYRTNTAFVFADVMVAGLLTITLGGRYAIEERNRQFLRSAFSKYVSPAVVDSLIRDPEKLSLGGRREVITILFCDIRSFTTYSEKLKATDLSRFLNDYLGRMTEIIFETSGTLDKYIGDAVMAFWGAPIAIPVHAEKAAEAAVKMVEAVNHQRARFEKTYGIPVRIGIGLNTGEVSVGNMGSERSFNYTVLGDAVNLASRLEAATKAFRCEILATQAVLNACVGSKPRHRPLGSVRVKGKLNAVEIVELVTAAISDEVLGEFETARSAYLQKNWERARAGFERVNEWVQRQRGEADGPSQVYLESIEMVIAGGGAPSDWDGVWETDK
jgi:adenylate cyclase